MVDLTVSKLIDDDPKKQSTRVTSGITMRSNEIKGSRFIFTIPGLNYKVILLSMTKQDQHFAARNAFLREPDCSKIVKIMEKQ